MILLIICAALLVLLLIGLLISNYIFNASFDRYKARFKLSANELTEKRWLELCEAEHVYITNDEGLKLHAWLKENHPNRWIILFHGYRKNGLIMSRKAKRFYDMGYSVLAPDMRAHGQSEGQYIGMGWPERKDVPEWITFINQEYDAPQIALYGLSMGAATVMMASGDYLPPNVMAIIEDCGYTDIKHQLIYNMKSMYHIPAFPLLYLTSIITRWKAGYNFLTEGSALEQVAKSQTPMLFIHGEKDTYVPYSNLKELFDAAGTEGSDECEYEKQMLSIPEAGHSESCKVAPELYWTTVADFLDEYFIDSEEDL